MAIFLLDTDTLSLHQRNHARVLAAVASRATDQLCVSTTTIEEQIGGWSALARSAKTPQAEEHAAMLLAAIVVSWNRFAIAPMNVSARTRFDLLVGAKLNVKHNDLRIAAIALELGATVVTRNRRDFSFIHRRSQQNARCRRTTLHLGNNQIRRTRQGMGALNISSAAIGEQKLPSSATRLGDAIRIRQC